MLKPDLESVKKTLEYYPFPVDVIVETISYCNLDCIMCPQGGLKRERGEMSFRTFKKIVDEIGVEGKDTRLWMAIMGEPLLRAEKITEMIRYAKESGIKSVHLNTNANLLTDNVAEKLIEAGLDEIIIGLDAHSASTYAHVRVKGDYERVMGNINNLIAHIAKKGSAKPKVIVQYIIMDENENEVESFKNYWLSRGAIVKIRPRLGWGTGVSAPNLNLPDSERTFPCPWLTRTVSIHWNGRFAQCDGDYEGEYSPGDIAQNTIKEIWNGPLAERRQRHWQLDFSHPLCSKCKDWQAGRSMFFYPEGEQHVHL